MFLYAALLGWVGMWPMARRSGVRFFVHDVRESSDKTTAALKYNCQQRRLFVRPLNLLLNDLDLAVRFEDFDFRFQMWVSLLVGLCPLNAGPARFSRLR